MKDIIKQILVGVIILLIAMGIFYFIVDPSFKNNVKDTLTFGGENILDVVKNPQKYEGEEIILKKASLYNSFSEGTVISAEESDGSYSHLKYNYDKKIYCDYANLKGMILKEGSYYFKITEVECRD